MESLDKFITSNIANTLDENLTNKQEIHQKELEANEIIL